MDKKALECRTKKFAVDVISFVSGLPKDKVGDVIGHQLLRSGTSIGANYREANRAHTYSDFIYKISLVEKEASETEYWLELLEGTGRSDISSLSALLAECDELLAIFTSIGKTSKARRANASLLEEDAESYDAGSHLCTSNPQSAICHVVTSFNQANKSAIRNPQSAICHVVTSFNQANKSAIRNPQSAISSRRESLS